MRQLDVGRLASHPGIGHVRRTNPDPSPSIALEHCWRGMYFRQLRPWLKYFDRAGILVLQYERCTLEPERELKRTFEFLGLEFHDYTIDASALAERVNAAVAGTTRPLHSLHKQSLIEMYRDDVRQLADAFPGQIDLSLWKNFAGADD